MVIFPVFIIFFCDTQTVGAHAHAEHTTSPGLWHDLRLGFNRVLLFDQMRDIIDRLLPALGG